MEQLNLKKEYLITSDNVRLCYYYTDEGKQWMILSNGLGANHLSWKYIIEYFSSKYRFLTWDYRGLYESKVPTDLQNFSIKAHVDDLFQLIEKLNIDKAIFVGWSIGVQVNFEFYKKYPEKVLAFVLINGSYGRLFERIIRISSKYFFPRLTSIIENHPEFLVKLAKEITKHNSLIKLLKYLQLISPTIDEELFLEIAYKFVDIDLKNFVKIFRAMEEHDLSDIFDKIEVPTLIIAGRSDRFTSVRLAKKMKNRIPNAELMIIPGGTHYLLLEYPEIVALRMEKFFIEHNLYP